MILSLKIVYWSQLIFTKYIYLIYMYTKLKSKFDICQFFFVSNA